METIRLAIPRSVLAYADFAACEYVPPKRTGGYNESGCTHQKRGDGDHLELLAKLTLKHYIVMGEGKTVRLELTSGMGDEADLVLWCGDPKTEWRRTFVDVKTSTNFPVRETLHLMVKAREAQRVSKDPKERVYIQCFVHLHEADDPEPHLHIAGMAKVRSSVWNKYLEEMGPLPNTGDHPGMQIPVGELENWDDLMERCRPAWV